MKLTGAGHWEDKKRELKCGDILYKWLLPDIIWELEIECKSWTCERCTEKKFARIRLYFHRKWGKKNTRNHRLYKCEISGSSKQITRFIRKTKLVEWFKVRLEGNKYLLVANVPFDGARKGRMSDILNQISNTEYLGLKKSKRISYSKAFGKGLDVIKSVIDKKGLNALYNMLPTLELSPEEGLELLRQSQLAHKQPAEFCLAPSSAIRTAMRQCRGLELIALIQVLSKADYFSTLTKLGQVLLKVNVPSTIKEKVRLMIKEEQII